MSDIDQSITRLRRHLNLDQRRGILGDTQGVVRDTSNGHYYVRIEKSPGNYYPPVSLPLSNTATVAPKSGVPVYVGYDPVNKREVIVGMVTSALEQIGISPFISNPSDPAAADLIPQERMATLYSRPHSDSLNKPFYAQVYPARLISASAVTSWPGGEINLASFLPASGNHRYVMVFIKSDFATLEAFGSTAQSTSSALGDTDLTEAFIQRTADSIAIRAYKMISSDLSLNGNFADSPFLRQFVSDSAIHSQYVTKSLFDANSLLIADTDNTPIALTTGAASDGDVLAVQADGTIAWETPSAGSAVAVKEDGASVVAAADTLDFKDAFDIVDAGSGDASIYLKLHDYAGGRLTLESGVPVSTTDQTAKTNVYYTPYLHDLISLFDGTRWRPYVFTEATIAVPATTSTPFDIFVYDNAGTLTYETVDWTNSTTRATAIVRQNGRWVKNGATSRRYLGTCCTTGTSGQCEDSNDFRGVWNCYNRVSCKLAHTEATDSWTYATQTWRSANNSTANRVVIVVGLSEVLLDLIVAVTSNQSQPGYYALPGIAEDATNTSIVTATDAGVSFINALANTEYGGVYAHLIKYPAIGMHYYQWTEIAQNGGTATFYSQASTLRQSGIVGSIEA